MHIHTLTSLALIILSSGLPQAYASPQQSALGGAASASPAPHVISGGRRAAPRGIYCSCPPTNANSDSVLADVARQPFVEGILVRVGWGDVEPARGVYDFDLIAGQLDRAARFGKRVTLALVQGSHTPAWLAGEGAQMVTYDFMGQPRPIAAAWDPIYQSIWSDTILAMGAMFGDDDRISLVHVCNASHNGFEMQLPLGAANLFTAAGYTEQGYVDSWKNLIDVYASAFPRHPIDVEVHPVFGSDLVAQEVTSYGLQKLGRGYGAFGAWWSVDNAADTYPGMFTLISESATNAFAAAQVVGSWVTTPERFDSDLQEYIDGFTLAETVGVAYVEVWNADLLEPSLAGILTAVNNSLTR